MRFYDVARERVLAFPYARMRFFLFGPFYLLWVRLWLEALACTVIVLGFVHAGLAVTAATTGIRSRLDMDAVLRAFHAVQNAADREIQADAAFRELVAASLPFYVAGFLVLVVMSALTYWLHDYLRWRLRRRGYIELLDPTDDEQESLVPAE